VLLSLQLFLLLSCCCCFATTAALLLLRCCAAAAAATDHHLLLFTRLRNHYISSIRGLTKHHANNYLGDFKRRTKKPKIKRVLIILRGGRRVSTSTWCPLVTAGLILLLKDTQRLRVGVETWGHRGVGGKWSYGKVQSFYHHEIRLPTILQQATRPRGVINIIKKN